MQSSMKVFKDLGSLDWQPDPIQPLCYELFMSTGAVGQASVIYAILKTFTPTCSTVYYILPDNDCIVPSVNPSPLSTSLVQYWNCASVTYCLMWPVRPWRFVLESVKRRVLSSDVCFGFFLIQFACSPSVCGGVFLVLQTQVGFIRDSDSPFKLHHLMLLG